MSCQWPTATCPHSLLNGYLLNVSCQMLRPENTCFSCTHVTVIYSIIVCIGLVNTPIFCSISLHFSLVKLKLPLTFLIDFPNEYLLFWSCFVWYHTEKKNVVSWTSKPCVADPAVRTQQWEETVEDKEVFSSSYECLKTWSVISAGKT